LRHKKEEIEVPFVSVMPIQKEQREGEQDANTCCTPHRVQNDGLVGEHNLFESNTIY